MSKPAALQFLLVEGNTWFVSALVKSAIGSRYSHVALLLPDMTTIEADWAGLKSYKLTSYAWPWVAREYECHPAALVRMEDWARGELQNTEPYDWCQALGLLIHGFLGWTGWARFANSRRHYVCSEFLGAALKQAGLEPPAPLDVITPKDFEMDSRATPATIRLEEM